MATGKKAVPIRKRTIAWVSSVVLGVAMYFVFEAILTVTPAREAIRIQGEIAAIIPHRAMAPAKSSLEQVQAEVAELRATISAFHTLYQSKAELEAEFKAGRFWAMMIGLVAGVGCFALCSVYWLRRGAGEASA